MLVLVIGPVIWSYIQPHLDVPWEWGWFYEALRYFIAVGLLYLVVALLYRWLPEPPPAAAGGPAGRGGHGRALADRSPACSRSICRTSAASRVTYGSLGGIVVTLLFFYVSAMIFIFGAEINSARRRAEADAPARRARAPSGEAHAG